MDVPAVRQLTACVVPRVPTVATPVALLDHTVPAEAVRFWVELSENVPVAVNPTAEPTNCVGFVGVTATLVSVTTTAAQVRVVLLVTAPTVALIELEPAVRQFTSCGFEAAPMVATEGVPLSQVALEVTSFFEPSLKVPVARNPRDEPTLTFGAAGVTTKLVSVTLPVQVTTVEPEIVPTVAVIVAVPAVKQFTLCAEDPTVR